MSAKAKPESIAEVGLEKWLDDRRDQQNGFGYKEFVFFTSPEIRVPDSALGRMYRVERQSIRRWKSYLKENS